MAARKNPRNAPRPAPTAGLGSGLVQQPPQPGPQPPDPKLAAREPRHASLDELENEFAPAPRRSAVDRKPVHQGVHARMSDADIMREFEGEEADQFYIDPAVIPQGLVYEWKRHEVYGQEDGINIVELQRRGWTAVMADEHPGYFMQTGAKGQVIRGGQGLYKMDEELHRRRQRFNQLVAQRTLREQEERLGLAPEGTGPRAHPKVRPQVRTQFEAAPDDIS